MGFDVMLIYLTGVVFGAMTGLLLSPDKMTVGASGGDYALIFAYMANLIINWDSMVKTKPWKWARLLFLAWFVAMDIWNFVSNNNESTSVGGHLGGAIVGLTLGLFVLENFYVQPAERYISWIALGLFVAFTIFSVGWQIFAPQLKEQDKQLPPCSYFGRCTSNC